MERFSELNFYDMMKKVAKLVEKPQLIADREQCDGPSAFLILIIRPALMKHKD